MMVNEEGMNRSDRTVRPRRVAIAVSYRHRALGTAAIATILAGAVATSAVLSVTADTSSPSAIGNANLAWLQVSPHYRSTGLVIAVASDLNCQSNCTHLWVTHNGGASWGKAKATNWNGGRPVIGTDGSGRDVLFATQSGGMQRSDDGGDTWHDAAAGGLMPQVEPSFAQDGAVAVAGPHDYVLRNGSSQTVTGSGGAYHDYQFFFAPGATSGGAPPALLSALGGQNSPVIQQCSADLTCHGSTVLANEQAGQMASFASLAFSSTYTSDRVVFAQANRDIYKSSDAGGTFVPLSIFAPEASTAVVTTPMMALAPGYSENGPQRTVYAAVLEVVPDPRSPRTGGGLFASGDGGTSWHRVGSPSPLDQGSDAVTVAPDGRLFAGYLNAGGNRTGAGLLCSTDGRTWQASCPAVGNAAGSSSAQGSKGGSATTGGKSTGGQPGATAAAGTTPGAGVPTGDSVAGAGSPGAGATHAAASGAGFPKPLIFGLAGLVLLVLAVARGVLGRRARVLGKPD